MFAARALCVASLSALLSGQQEPAVRKPTAPPARTEYEICFHHTLRNRTDRELKDVRVYFPVPPSDAYQQISDYRVERSVPAHVTNRTDGFGNKLKRVTIARIPARGTASVGFSCTVSLADPARVSLEAADPEYVEPPPEARALYTRDDANFGLATPIIGEAAGKLSKEHPDAARRAHAIHDFVASTIAYEGGGGWDSAPKVLERKRGSCTEFAYLFSALCRATGIPTRLVGASIFPARSQMPFVDGGHHRWAQAFLPGLGWVDFDPTLDAGRPPKQKFVGTHHARTLVLTRIGDRALQLGQSYVSSNSHTGETSRSQEFVWSQGTLARLAEAKALLESGDRKAGEAILRELTEKQRGTRAAGEAELLLADLK